ncbi:hypothetical protein [Roseicyclus sp.]|uniref:hypothetical protein n=1 Tax=Roseicyclus sp. TaxID=1914329 RepID=UPI003F6AFB05
MPKEFACALTHVRHEGFFLEKWIAHYSAIVGRENLFIVIDGDDWTPSVDLNGITTEILHDAPRRRIQNDRFMASEMSRRANTLRKSYDFVIRGDCDEYVVIDPEAGLDWPTALQELGEEGYVFALGIDVVHGPDENTPLALEHPFIGPRRFGYMADTYTKPFVISRWNNWAGGAHRLINRPVRMSAHFVLFHMALADHQVAHDRLIARGGTAQHRSFVGHQTDRLDAIVAAGSVGAVLDFAEAKDIAYQQFPYDSDGSPAKRPRKSSDPRALEQGLPIEIPERFMGLV